MSASVSVVVAATPAEVAELSALPILCAQCNHQSHASEARFCLLCGGALVQHVPHVPSSDAPSSPVIGSAPHSTAPSVESLLSSLDPHTRARMDFSTKLWDMPDRVFEKSRASKHTAKGMAAMFAEVVKVERAYATGLAKLVANPEYGALMEANELKSPATSTLMHAWSGVKSDLVSRSRAHAAFAESLTAQVETPLAELRKLLSWKKDQLERGVTESADALRKAAEQHAKLKAKHEKMSADLSLRGAASKLTAQEVALAFEAATTAQLTEFKARNAHNRTLSENLTSLQELEVERLMVTRRLLLAHRLAQSQTDRQYLQDEATRYAVVQAIDEVAEVTAWVEINQTRTPCPWASEKTALTGAAPPPVPPRTPPAAVMVGASILGTHLSVTPAASPSVHVSPSPVPRASPAPPGRAAAAAALRTTPGAGAAANAAPRVPRATPSAASAKPGRVSRQNSLVLSAEAVAIVSAESPVIAALAAPPTSAGQSLPANISLQELPFPTIGLPRRVEPLPNYSWMPSVASLFPEASPDALPDISSLTLSAAEYNRLAYEQVLLGTNLLRDVPKEAHASTLRDVVRVQLRIPHAEHELLVQVLSIAQGVLPNSPSALTAAEQQSTQRRRTSLADGVECDGDAADQPKLHVAESMMYVDYRLRLLQSTNSGRFPTLQLYEAWVHRQVHAIWLALVWTVHTQQTMSSRASRKDRSSPVCSLSLDRFKRTLQVVQLLAFTVTSKVATKLFHLGDSIAEDHADMRALCEELHETLQIFPTPFTSALTSNLHYPTAMLNKVYLHLLHRACITGGDEAGQVGGDGADADDDSSDSEDGIVLHESYLSILASLSFVRTQWKVSEFHHQYALLRLLLHIIYYQSLDYDGKLLDAEGMLSDEGEHSLLPLLSYVTHAICGTLHREAAAVQASRAERIRPDAIESEERRFLCYALRNVGYALSDFCKFSSGPVGICFEFYHDIAGWIGVADVPERMQAFLRISTTNFYQTLIPTEQLLILPTGTSGVQTQHVASSTTKTSTDDNSPSSHLSSASVSATAAAPSPLPSHPASSGAAQIQITPKKMQYWSPLEWKSFSKQLGRFVRDQIEDSFVAFTKRPSLRGVFGTHHDAQTPSPNCAEVCILQVLRCFCQDVQCLSADRLRAAAGMDETLVSLVSSLVRLQHVLMDVDYAEFWSSGAVKKDIAVAFPNLQEVCATAMKRWMEVQKTKVEGIRQRCVSLDNWSPVDDLSGHKFSASVKDLFSFLNTLHDAFWSYSRNMHGFGVSDSLPVFIALFDTTLIQYGAQIVESAGLDVLPQVMPTKDVKLKQAKEAPDNKDKAKAFVKGLFKKEAKSTGKEEEEEAVGVIPPELPQTGLVTQTIQSLCVRLCSIESAIDNSSDLSQALRTHAQSFIDEFPMVAPAEFKPGDKSAVEEAHLSQKRWSIWAGCFTPPTRMPHPDSTNVFRKAVEQMREQIETLAGGIGVAKVYIDWRSTWLNRLYLPMPLDSNRIRDGELEARIEESMPVVHQCLTRTLFPIVAKHIFAQLMSAVQYVLLYGRRSIQETHVQGLIRSDLAQLIDIYSQVVPAVEMNRATREIQELLDVMTLPTDDLIHMYTTQRAPLPFPIMARIIAARSGRNAQKLIDKIRGK